MFVNIVIKNSCVKFDTLSKLKDYFLSVVFKQNIEFYYFKTTFYKEVFFLKKKPLKSETINLLNYKKTDLCDVY